MSKKRKPEAPSEIPFLPDPEYTLTSRVTLSDLYTARQREIAFLAMHPLPSPKPTVATAALVTKCRDGESVGSSSTLQANEIVGAVSPPFVEVQAVAFTQHRRPMRLHQRVAPHLRRRAASHNPHRLRGTPALRARALQEESGSYPRAVPLASVTSSAPQRKRHRRQSRRQRDSPQEPAAQCRRRTLVTHLWHAKRAQMRTTDALWGNVPSPPYALAYTFSMKGFRSFYRTVRKRAVLYDASYTHIIALSASHTTLLALCELLLRSDTPVNNVFHVNGSRAGYACAYDFRTQLLANSIEVQSLYPRGAIGPVIYLWAPLNSTQDTTERQLWFLTHPTISNFLVARLHHFVALRAPEVQVRLLEDVFICYEVLGPTSGDVLIRAFSLHDTNKRNSSASMPETEREVVLSALGTRPSTVASGTVLAVSLTDPRLTRLGLSSFPLRSYVATSFLSSELKTIPTPPCSPLWDPRNFVQFQPTLTTHAINQLKAKGDVATLAAYTQEPAMIPVLFIRHPVTEGWIILGPRSWGLALWMALVMCGGGVRVIGLQFRDTLTWMRDGRCVFPSHFPDTLAYTNYSAVQSHQLLADYSRRPPAKRINFDLLGFPDPFRLPFALLFGSSVDVWVWRSPLLQKLDGQSVCALTRLFTQDSMSSDPEYRHDIELLQLDGALVAVWVTPRRGRIAWGARLYKCSSENQHGATKDVLLGFVVEGAFHFDRGTMVGLAFCSVAALRQYNRDVAIVQNLDTPHTHQVYLTLCARPY
jgi:hypothetical protein